MRKNEPRFCHAKPADLFNDYPAEPYFLFKSEEALTFS